MIAQQSHRPQPALPVKLPVRLDELDRQVRVVWQQSFGMAEVHKPGEGGDQFCLVAGQPKNLQVRYAKKKVGFF